MLFSFPPSSKRLSVFKHAVRHDRVFKVFKAFKGGSLYHNSVILANSKRLILNVSRSIQIKPRQAGISPRSTSRTCLWRLGTTTWQLYASPGQRPG